MSIGMFSLQGDSHFFIIFGLFVAAVAVIIFLLACMARQEEQLELMRIKVGLVNAELVRATSVVEALGEGCEIKIVEGPPAGVEKGHVIWVEGNEQNA